MGAVIACLLSLCPLAVCMLHCLPADSRRLALGCPCLQSSIWFIYVSLSLQACGGKVLFEACALLSRESFTCLLESSIRLGVPCLLVHLPSAHLCLSAGAQQQICPWLAAWQRQARLAVPAVLRTCSCKLACFHVPADPQRQGLLDNTNILEQYEELARLQVPECSSL